VVWGGGLPESSSSERHRERSSFQVYGSAPAICHVLLIDSVSLSDSVGDFNSVLESVHPLPLVDFLDESSFLQSGFDQNLNAVGGKVPFSRGMFFNCI
jgi:hypothetical protein